MDTLGQTFTLSSGWLFVAGVITGAVGLLGVTLLVGGMARARRRRVALAQSRGAPEELQADRDRLAAELDHERARRTSTTPPSSRHRAAAAAGNRPAIDLAGEERARSASTENAFLADGNGREPVAVGGHGIFHRRDH